MVPVLDFTKEWTDGLEGYNRLFNRSVVYSKLDNGKVVPLTTEFEDVGDLASGKAPELIALSSGSTHRTTWWCGGSSGVTRPGSRHRSVGVVPIRGPAPPSCPACRPGVSGSSST